MPASLVNSRTDEEEAVWLLMIEQRPFVVRISSLRSLSKRIFEGKIRFMMPLLIIVFAKIVGALWIYSLFSSSGYFITPWLEEVQRLGLEEVYSTQMDFFYLFTSWDSGLYIGIAKYGYSSFSFIIHNLGPYAFFPGYPLVIRALWLVIRDIVAAAVLPALVFGIAWLPFFQAVAEHYMPRPEAFGCTLLAAFFPIVFLSTTVAYSESLFLFASIASWYYYLKDEILYANLLAALAAITRVVGIFFVIPIFLDLLFHRKWKLLLYTFIPPLAFLGWVTYCFLSTGDWFIFWSVQERWYPMLGTLLKDVVPILLGAQIRLEFPDLFYLMWAILAGYLVFRSWDYDWRLATYASSVFILLLLFGIAKFPYTSSSLRHISIVFPMWLGARAKNPIAIAIACTLSYLLALTLWHQFLAQYWIL